MEASQSQAAVPAPEPSPTGELVVQNGPQAGTRRALSAPVTLLGHASGCDFRLQAKGVHPWHCLLVQGPDGLVLRGLQGDGTTRVNGQQAGVCVLREGDLITVGPFRFQVRLPRASGPQDVELLRNEKEALRIQAAAVAAQQAALAEEEGRLQQRRVVLQRQEEQLAAHLEERRSHLVELRNQVGAARTELRKERATHAEQLAAARQELERGRRDNLALQLRLQLKRQRLVKLHRGLKRRWQRHGAAERAALLQREAALAGKRRELEKEAERLEQERAALAEERLRLNGKVELGRRQMDDSRRQLDAARREWEHWRGREQMELAERAQVLELRALELAQAESTLARRKRQWNDARLGLEEQVEGLENRIRNQRRKLLDQQGEMARLGAVIREMEVRANQLPALPATGPSAEAPTPGPQAMLPALRSSGVPEQPLAPAPLDDSSPLEAEAAELADQRLHLAEQFERLLWARQRWQEQREAVAAELESLGLRLEERERQLEARALALAPTENALLRRRAEAIQVRAHLESWRARLAAREAAWDTERESLVADLGAREQAVQRQQEVLADLRQRWARRRQEEVGRLRAEQARCQDAFLQLTSLWEECFRRNAALEQEQRALAEKAMGLEQYRLEVVGGGENAAAAERRLERLRRRWAALSRTAERRLILDRQALDKRLAALDERFRQLRQVEEDLTRRDAELADRQTDAEQGQAAAAQTIARLQQLTQSLRAHRDLTQRQSERLREAVERMALTLIEEDDASSPPAMQAA